MAEHNNLLLSLMVATACVMVLVFTFNGLSGRGPPLYLNSTGSISDKYDTSITPSGWTFSIWGVIYLWQVLWVIFAFANIFRKTKDGPAYTNPIILTVPLFITYIINLCLNIAWTFFFDRQMLELAFPTLFLIAFTLYICLILSYRKLSKFGPLLAEQGRFLDIWLHRILVHNAFGIYATWTTIATLLNMIMVMRYRSSPGVDLDTAATVALGFLTAIIAVYVVTDWFFFDKYSRYTITPYLVVIVALGGSIDKNYNPAVTNSIFSVVLLGIALALTVVKIIVMLWRHFKRPLYTSSNIEPTSYTLKA